MKHLAVNMEEIASVKLAQICPIPLHLAWHENKTSYFSCRKEKKGIHLRLHRLFAKAPSPVLEALIGYAMKGDAPSGVIVRQMANLYFTKTRIEPEPLKAKGKVYDLEVVRDQVKEKCFSLLSPDLEVAIGWSTQVRVGKFRSITFGCYDRHRHQVRINPLLDDPLVPLYFLEFIVYHEMLHAICPPRIDARGAVHSHTKQFRLLERRFPQFEEAKAWEQNSLKFFKMRRLYGRS